MIPAMAVAIGLILGAYLHKRRLKKLRKRLAQVREKTLEARREARKDARITLLGENPSNASSKALEVQDALRDPILQRAWRGDRRFAAVQRLRDLTTMSLIECRQHLESQTFSEEAASHSDGAMAAIPPAPTANSRNMGYTFLGCLLPFIGYGLLTAIPFIELAIQKSKKTSTKTSEGDDERKAKKSKAESTEALRKEARPFIRQTQSKLKLLIDSLEDPSLQRRPTAIKKWIEDAKSFVRESEPEVGQTAALSENPERNGDLLDSLKDIRQSRIKIQASIEGMERVLKESQALYESSVVKYKDQWRAAIETLKTKAVYKDLPLNAQSGLVPLGEDFETGLWLFLHLQTNAQGHRPSLPKESPPQMTEQSGVVFILIPGGSVKMGDQAVSIPPFFLSKYETTQAQWQRVMTTNPSFFGPGKAKHENLCQPVEQVSWFDARDFASKLRCRLPSESEWEYGCRAGTTTKYYWGDEVDMSYCWVSENSDRRSHDVRAHSSKANAFGLVDMTGNVLEWCEDDDMMDSKRFPGDHLAQRMRPKRSLLRVQRGGNWCFSADYGQSSMRSAGTQNEPKTKKSYLGFRLARSYDH